MGFSVAQAQLADILHVISQALLIPVIILLILFIAYALFCIGSVISEYFTERQHFKVVMPKFLAALMAAKQDEVPQVIEQSGLLNRQKAALLTVYDYRMLPGDSLVALIRREVNQEESRYDRIRSRNNTAARVAPMIGLMGTLIPLGPGIEALGRADTAALSSSLLVAFDTTVAGLVVAAVCLVVGKIRGNWYDNYLSALDAAMATMLEKIEGMRDRGEITAEEPTDYAFLFEQGAERQQGKSSSAASRRAEDETPARKLDSTTAPLDDDPLARIGIQRVTPQPAPVAEARIASSPDSSPASISSSLPSAMNEPAASAEPQSEVSRRREDGPRDRGITFEPPRQPFDAGE